MSFLKNLYVKTLLLGTPKGSFAKDEWLVKVKIQIATAMIFTAVIALMFLSVSDFYTRSTLLGWLELIFALVLLPSLYLLRQDKRYYHRISFIFFIAWFMVLLVHFQQAEHQEFYILWFVSFLTMVFFLRDKREGLIWLALTLFSLIVILLFSSKAYVITDYLIMTVNILFISVILFWYEILKEKDKEHLREHNELLEDEIALHTIDLKEAKIKAERENQIKSEFLANMSHEIRTPLNAIQGFIALLREQEIDKQKQKYLKTITQASDTLLEIVNDVLDISKIESNKLDISRIDFDTQELFHSIGDLFSARSLEKNIFFHVSLDPLLPQYLHSDPLRLRQIITNLLSNALKFTPPNGSINFRVIYENNKLSCSIKDNGIGIPREKQQSIFEQFTQAHESTSRDYGGTGLGLAISYRLVSLLGGTLKVSSQVGLGSEFYFTIAIAQGSKPKEQLRAREHLPLKFQSKLLLVEDNEANRLLMRVLLDGFGIQYDIAVDGLEAVMLVKMNTYDMILMDENLPNLNGIQATKRIREYEKSERKARTPIIALTANALKGAKEHFFEAGADFHVTKPVSKEILHQIFAQYLLPSKQNYDMMVESELSMINNNKPLVDKAGQIGIDTQMLEEILILFFDKLPQQIAQMQHAIDQNDFEALHVISHTIKGTAANLFFEHIAQLASRIEQAALTQSCTNCPNLFQELMAEITAEKSRINL